MLKEMFWKNKVKNFVNSIHEKGKNYSIILGVEPDAYKVWDVRKNGKNYLLVKSTKSCAKTNGNECNFIQIKELEISIPKNAIKETLVNEITEYYPNDNLQSFISI